MTRLLITFPRFGAIVVWLAALAMIAAALCGCSVLPYRTIEVNVRITT